MNGPYSAEQNGVSERLNQTLNSNARTLLLDSKLGEEFWEDLVIAATYDKNRTPSSNLDWKTPYEVWYGKPPSIMHLIERSCLIESGPIVSQMLIE